MNSVTVFDEPQLEFASGEMLEHPRDGLSQKIGELKGRLVTVFLDKIRGKWVLRQVFGHLVRQFRRRDGDRFDVLCKDKGPGGRFGLILEPHGIIRMDQL